VLLEYTKDLSYYDLIKDDRLKSLLKDAFKGTIPNQIINRPKHGFNVPIDLWLKNDWKDLIDESFGKASFLRKHNIIDNNLTIESVNNMMNDDIKLNGHTVFCLIVLNIWLGKEFND
jgi:asparagine synthase (glutamine-hydrolysing)